MMGTLPRRGERPQPNAGSSAKRHVRVRARSFLATVVVLISVPLGVFGLAVPAASANTPDCSLGTHCYSILQGYGTTFYGMNGSWNRADMYPGNGSAGNQIFMDSEMWFGSSCGNYWVEEGLFSGYEPDIGKMAYEVFFGWRTTGGVYNYQPIAYTSPNGATTDNYQISSPSGGVWNVYWDGNHYTTPNVGFNSGACLQLGAEVATPTGCSRTFNMYSHAYNSAYQAVDWAAQYGYFSPAGIGGKDLNGVTYQNSEWSWNTVVLNGTC
jgi:hypothetical protein